MSRIVQSLILKCLRYKSSLFINKKKAKIIPERLKRLRQPNKIRYLIILIPIVRHVNSETTQ